MSNPHFPYRVVHTPAECVPSCDDRECPYIHRDLYDVFLRDVHCEGPFTTSEEANERATRLAWLDRRRSYTAVEFAAEFPWRSPTADNETLALQPGVIRLQKSVTIAHCLFSAHKISAAMRAIPDENLDRIDGLDWEAFSVAHVGTQEPRVVWGMHKYGIGAFNVMVPLEFCRRLLPHERRKWHEQQLLMVGSHTGKVSYSLPSGVSKEEEAELSIVFGEQQREHA